MNTTDLAHALAADADITQAEARRVLASLTRVVGRVLASGDTVRLSGLGSFAPQVHAARGASIKGQHYEVPARTRIHFKAWPQLLRTLNSTEAPR